MAGGLVNIVAYGAQDLFLTGTPQITFFKVVYRRHTNFSIESIEIPFDDQVDFGIESKYVIQPIGDLVSKTYLKIILPEVALKRKIDFQEINNLGTLLKIAQTELRRAIIFVNVNMNAYRYAIEVAQADNIYHSDQIIKAIDEIFENYYIPTKQTYEPINYFRSNSPINTLPPSQFNLSVIANKYRMIVTSKEYFMAVLNGAYEGTRELIKYYEKKTNEYAELLEDRQNSNYKFAWIDKIGHNILDTIEVSIGGERIDRQFGDWLNIWNSLTLSYYKQDIYREMIGDVSILTDFNRKTKPQYTLYVPFQFWFNRFYGLALPLVAIQYSEITISVRLKNLNDCAYMERTKEKQIDLTNIFRQNGIANLQMSLLIDFVYLDSLERRRFAQSSHEYLIDQLQVIEVKEIKQLSTTIDMTFNNPCREIIWVAQKNIYTINKDGYTKCLWDNYTPTKFSIDLESVNLPNSPNDVEDKRIRYFFIPQTILTPNNQSIEKAEIKLNGLVLSSSYSAPYYSYVQPYEHHTRIPVNGIYVYSFALKPEEHQPSGSCNFTRVSIATLELTFNPEMFVHATNELQRIFEKTSVNVRIYALSINVLRIMNGFGGIAFV